jgi:CDP-4-dehydro-6-deoxyglucose reductase
VSRVETDVLLEVDDLGGIALPAAKTFPCRISEIKSLASDVSSSSSAAPAYGRFSFSPRAIHRGNRAKRHRRSYSLANANFADRLLELHHRAVEGGALSQYWFSQAKPNDLLRLNGIVGYLFLRESAGLDLIF